MKPFIDWLYATPLSLFFQTEKWIIPTVQIIHIICLSVVFTSMIMLDFRLIGMAGGRHSVEYIARRFLPWLWRALPVLLLTGLVMIIAEPARDLKNAAFYLKMAFLIVSCLLMIGFQRTLRRDPAAWEESGSRIGSRRAIGAVSIVLWVGIVVSGRLIAYV